jgi:hypothetical protein
MALSAFDDKTREPGPEAVAEVLGSTAVRRWMGGSAPTVLILFGVIDAAAAIWTALALKVDAAAEV